MKHCSTRVLTLAASLPVIAGACLLFGACSLMYEVDDVERDRGDLELVQGTFIDTGQYPDGASGKTETLPSICVRRDDECVPYDPADDGVLLYTTVQPQGNGPELAVIEVRNLSLPTGVTVQAMGDRGLLIIAYDTIEIGGILDATPYMPPGGTLVNLMPGPGGNYLGAGTGAGSVGRVLSNQLHVSGGGGAGFGQSGALGGDACIAADSPCARGGMQGPFYGEEDELPVLLGGSRGGDGTKTGTGGCSVGAGGYGGGAVQLLARNGIYVRENGVINAGGGGALASLSMATTCVASGGGGGSGGTIFLQAPVVEVAGVLAANGGGGSGGAATLIPPPAGETIYNNGARGMDGQASAEPARGGAGPNEGASAGGAGGTGDLVPEPGGMIARDGGAGAGGGGGAAGRIYIQADTFRQTGTISPKEHRLSP